MPEPTIMTLPIIMAVSYWLTERLSEWVPAGRVRKLLVPVPVLLSVCLAALVELSLAGGVTWAGFYRSALAGCGVVLSHNVRKAGESSQ